MVLTLAATAPALADTPDSFVQTGHSQLETLLKQPTSAQRDAQISAAFDKMLDYDELIRRCFKEHWRELTAAQQGEVGGLLKQIVQKNYKKNLKRTLNYDLTYTGTRTVGSDVIVGTQAKSKIDPREPPVQVEYVVSGTGAGPFHVVDIIAENAAMTKAYYEQFHKFLNTPGQGYPYIVQKLKDKIVKLDQQQ